MPMKNGYKTLAVPPKTLDRIKQITKQSGEIQYRLIERLVTAELEKVRAEQKEKAA